MEKQVIAQVGLGAWGANLLRTFNNLPDCRVKVCCDLDQQRLTQAKETYADIAVTARYDQLLCDPEIEAIVVATPAAIHYTLAKEALLAGKHVFVEKPIALDVSQAEELVSLASKSNKKLMVGHLLLYHPAVTRLKQLITDGDLGRLYYIYTQRLNLGKVRRIENVMWSLAPHDLSVILHMLGRLPQSVAAHGSSFVQKGIEDVAFLNLRFSGGETGHVHVSWLDPTKTRRTVVVGSRKMAVFDEMAGGNKLVLFDKGVQAAHQFASYEQFLKLRFGEERVVKLSDVEPLRVECRHFLDCIRENREPLSSGENGVAVLKVLDAAQRSLTKGGSHEIL